MRLFQQSESFTAAKFLLVFVVCAGTVFGSLLDNTLDTGENLFSTVPVSVITAGSLGSYLVYTTENTTGYSGFLPGQSFKTVDVIDDFVFGKALPVSSAALWLSGKIANSDQVESTGEELCRGLVFSYGIVQTVKIATGRERPDGSNNWSFPSGHTAGAACATAVLWNRYGADVGIPLTAITLYTCLSRVNLGKHFPSDVIMGAAIGVACGIASSMVNSESGDAGLGLSVSIDTQGRITPGLWEH